MKYNEINNPVKERGMPSSIIKHKQKLAMMTDKELADRFKDADEDKLRRMAWGHGYGKMSSHYWDRVQNARTTGGFREEDPKPIMRDPLDSEQAKDMQRDKDRMIFHGKEIDQNSIQYEMQDYSDMIFELHMANYIDGTELDEKELEELEGTDELQEWVRIDYVSEDKVQEDEIPSNMPGSIGDYAREVATGKLVRVVDYTDDDEGIYTISYGEGKGETDVMAKDLKFIDPTIHQDLESAQEGFIGKKMEYTDFLQNKLDTAIQEYDTPEKKAEREAMVKAFLAKGGSVEKVPAGQTAYKGKELKPAFKKNPGTPHTSPTDWATGDESVEEQNIYINGMTTRKDVIQNILDNINNGDVDSAVDDLAQYLEIAEKDDAGISEQDVPKDHEYGPSSDKAPAGKRGYQSSPGARTAHLKTVKTLARKRRRQMDKTATTETNPAPGNKQQNYSDKEVRQAKGIAFDKRYKGGNYTGASNTIDKLKKGLSSHPDVADALRRANEDKDAYAPARLIGAAEASLTYGLQMAQHVINKDYGIAERNARVIAENWPPLIDKIKNVYKTNERVENGVIMCPEACCGKPVTECKCSPMCEHCNCFIIKAQENKSESQDGLQPADLKRLGQTEPKIYVHKNGKTIMIPKRKHNEYIAKGWKQSALRAETSYESKLTDMLNQQLK